ncbi:glyoxylase-like metal-dependent hydrolase (beta-lactamase superfamily II) [Kineococcus radiotolerans]|uniref:Glyoxylase-like metal-dependent hydrolase (Beta-lactamase superfamily II) n=1 Tax=Kineococcus radiotolerans TaxID=131568 RepID=A0A7W4TR67_KINRA|nr:MBL fold metallo-hydrolase [Kineococcus radiotolerans]MBB2903593.1 glyoxylase-like metal-dependent hydrolase (beta-lactamase superfamily II) [Kineococcus radiotolerans]
MNRDRMTVTEVAPLVFSVQTALANWYLLREGHEVTLVDGGYPADAPTLLASLDCIGAKPGDVRAVLVTHAHTDHIGGLPLLLRQRPDLPVLLHPGEVAHARREHLEQVSVATIVRHAWRPRVAAWAVQAVRRGGTQDPSIDRGTTFGATTPRLKALDLPGTPVPVPTPGHTSGHTAFLLPEVGAVITGDALVTGHPTTAHEGPQLLPAFFHHDVAEAVTALDALAGLPADLILPGHGRAWRVAMDAAVAAARARRGVPRS